MFEFRSAQADPTMSTSRLSPPIDRVHPFLVVSYCMPTRTTGTPVVVRKLLENFAPSEVVLIGRPVKRSNAVAGYSPHYVTYQLTTPPVGTRGEKIWRLLSVFIGVLAGLSAIRKHDLKCIVAFYRDESSLLTGYLLHKLTQRPFYPYFCDLYLENYPNGFYHLLAKWLQARVFHTAQKVFVLTEAMKEHYHKQYGVDAVVLPHCVNDRVPQSANSDRHSNGRATIRIAHLGSVNDDRIPSLRLLCEAIRDNARFELMYFTSQSPEFLRREGLAISNSTTKFIPDDALLRSELEKCDILFLPATLSDEHKYREAQVLTGFPTKAIEYLFVQRPILVHSKSNYFVARFFDDHRCGHVVEGGAADIFGALQTLVNDRELRETLSRNSFGAVSYFSGRTIANRLRETVSSTAALKGNGTGG